MDWFHMLKQNAELRQTNVALTYENEWLFSYALDGDELLAKARAQVANPQAEQLAAVLFESERELETMWRERDEARAQRDRLNEQCDTLTREAAEQIGELHRLLLEATLARDDYRARYEATMHTNLTSDYDWSETLDEVEARHAQQIAALEQARDDYREKYETLRTHLNGQDAVKPKVPRGRRGKEE